MFCRVGALIAIMISLVLNGQSKLENSPRYGGDHLKLNFFPIDPSIFSDVDLTVLREINLIKVISEPEENRIHDFLVYVDEASNLKFLVRKSSPKIQTHPIEEFGDTPTIPIEAEEEIQTIPIEDLTAGEVVIARASDKAALLISCPEFEMEKGGVFVIRYLYNGVMMSYKTLEVKLKRVKGSADQLDSWVLMTKGDALIKTLHLVSRKIFGTLIGIDRIDINRR